MTYWDTLEPDYTIETADGMANELEPRLETMRRLLFMCKLAVNGHMVLLSDEDEGVVAISPEFEKNFDWTLEEFQAVTPEEFFHEDSLDIATTHRDNHLAAPYIARCYKKGGGLSYYKIQGLCVEFDQEHWRMLSFEKI